MISSYRFGHIIVNGNHYVNDVIIFPDRVESKWWRKHGHHLQDSDIKTVVEGEPEILVVATGYYGVMKVSADTAEFLQSRGIKLVV